MPPNDAAMGKIESQTDTRVRRINDLIDDLNQDLDKTQEKISQIMTSSNDSPLLDSDVRETSTTDFNEKLLVILERLESFRSRQRDLNSRIDL